MSSAAMVVVEDDADANRQCPVSPTLHTRHRVNTSGWPVAIRTVGAQCRHRYPSPVVRISAPNFGSGRMSGPESHRQPWRVRSDRSRHSCPSPVVQIFARNLGSGQVNGPEFHHQPRRVSSARWHAHLSSVGKPPSVHRRSAATRARLRSLRSPESCETQLMPNALLAHRRTGPNPALKRNASSVARRPSSAGPYGPFCARCPARHAVGVRLALR